MACAGLAEVKWGKVLMSSTLQGHFMQWLSYLDGPHLHIFGLYLHDGEGLSQRNIDIMAKVGTQARGIEHFVIGGDWNMWPGQVELTGMQRAVLGTTVAPAACKPTCDTGRTTSIIDFFVMSDSMSSIMAGDEVNMAWAPAPHRPYRVWFHSNVTKVQQLVFKAPPVLPRERVYGPLPKQPGYEAALSLAEKAAQLAGSDRHFEAQAALDIAWKHFSSCAEEELAGATDHGHIRKGQRSCVPRAAMVDVFTKKRKVEDFNAIRDGWRWLLATSRTASRLAQEPASATVGNELLLAHCQTMACSEYPGAGLLASLDRQADKLKHLLLALPMEDAMEGVLPAGDVWRRDIKEVMDDLAVEDEAAHKIHTKGLSSFWDAWRDEAFAKGGRGMHRATKLKAGWTPTVVEGLHGGTDICPRDCHQEAV